MNIGNLICLTPRDSYVADNPIKRRGILGRLENRTGPFVRSPGIAFPYLIGFLRKNGVLTDATRLVVQHDRIEGPTALEEVLTDKVDLSRGDCDVLFITAYTDSAREAYRRAREARGAPASRAHGSARRAGHPGDRTAPDARLFPGRAPGTREEQVRFEPELGRKTGKRRDRAC